MASEWARRLALERAAELLALRDDGSVYGIELKVLAELIDAGRRKGVEEERAAVRRVVNAARRAYEMMLDGDAPEGMDDMADELRRYDAQHDEGGVDD